MVYDQQKIERGGSPGLCKESYISRRVSGDEQGNGRAMYGKASFVMFLNRCDRVVPLFGERSVGPKDRASTNLERSASPQP